ncbi:MAG TPA: head GIN domain-containing protein [Cyclobacteriaceae bacterium]|nr:head GIN domain-containing protein [Cyclobacteriaceae bacterium]
MKKRLLYSFLAVFAFVFSQAYAQKETRKVEDFTRISFGIPADLYLKQGSGQEVLIEGDEEDLENIITEVVNNQLRVRTRDNNWFWDDMGEVTVYITVPVIEEVSLGGSGKIMSSGQIKSDNLKLSVSGSGKMEMLVDSHALELGVSGSGRMELEVNTGDIDEDISGSGSISLRGSANNANLSISGSGKLEATDLSVKSYDISISGSGRSNIAVSEAITARISGSGNVYYKGQPDKVISKVSGSGNVRKMD